MSEWTVIRPERRFVSNLIQSTHVPSTATNPLRFNWRVFRPFVCGAVLVCRDGYSCASSPLRSTFRLSLACTVWDLFACSVGSWAAQKLMKLRTAAPLLAGAITCAGLASIPFWIYRGYGHFLYEGTWVDISCFFAEGSGLAFPFVVATALGFLTLLHGVFWLRVGKDL
jgi:hypothetical protein